MEVESCSRAHVCFRRNCLAILENVRWKKSMGGSKLRILFEMGVIRAGFS